MSHRQKQEVTSTQQMFGVNIISSRASLPEQKK